MIAALGGLRLVLRGRDASESAELVGKMSLVGEAMFGGEGAPVDLGSLADGT